jgi:antitoxin component YwqK of YwqJK toxin-antitoxin module
MLKSILSIPLIVLLLPAMAQLSKTDDWEKRCEFVEKEGKEDGLKQRSYFIKGDTLYTIRTLSYKNGVLNGPGKNEITGSTENYLNGKLHGDWSDYHKNGQLKSTGTCENGLVTPNGKRTHFYENGKVRCEFNYKDAMLHGDYKSWYENGQLKATGGFENNHRKGLWTVYSTEGKKLVEREYTDNRNYTLVNVWDHTGKQIIKKGKGVLTYYRPFHDRGGEMVFMGTDTTSPFAKAEIPYKKGKMNGMRKEWYPDGKKRLEINYINNQRDGKYSLWFHSGKPYVERTYNNDFVVGKETLYNEDGEVAREQKFEPAVHNSSYKEYAYLSEFDVIFSKRIWRIIEPGVLVNKPFFDTLSSINKTLFQHLFTEALSKKSIKAYMPYSDVEQEDDQFRSEFSFDKYNTFTGIDLQKVDIENIKVLGYKLKEDFFYNDQGLIGDQRIIGICPIVEITNKTTGKKEERPLFWLYYPSIRKTLAAVELAAPTKNIENKLFDRLFSSYISKESNVYDRAVLGYKDGADVLSEGESIEVGKLELEHDNWIYNFTGK